MRLSGGLEKIRQHHGRHAMLDVHGGRRGSEPDEADVLHDEAGIGTSPERGSSDRSQDHLTEHHNRGRIDEVSVMAWLRSIG